MTYLTLCLLNASSNSFKFCSIGGIAIGSITFDAHLMAGREALSGCQALPVAVFFVLHFFEGREFPDRLIHGKACLHYTGKVRSVFGIEIGARLAAKQRTLPLRTKCGGSSLRQNDRCCGGSRGLEALFY